MSDDDRRPRITRTTSLFTYQRRDPRSGQPIGGPAPDPRYGGVSPYQQAAAQQVDSDREATAKRNATGASASFYTNFLDDQLRNSRVASTVQGETTTQIGVSGEQTASVAGILDAAINPETQFLFDRGSVVDPLTGNRTGVLASRGVYGSADSLERQTPAGTTVQTGTNENVMTISAGVLWLRNLAVRDPKAYNDLVVLLRNAGYGNLPDDDRALPLNGYTNDVGAAFALAANDLAQAGQGGDKRTLLEYLTDRGQGYAALLAEQAAEQAEADRYKPVERAYQDPATIRAAAKQAAIDALGRKLTPEEEARLEASFRAQEDAFFDQLDVAREGGTKFAQYAPDSAGQVEDFIDGDEFETERAANKIGELSQVFMQMMGVG